MSVHASSEEAFQRLVQVSRSSVAHPPQFAPPVDAWEAGDDVHLTFIVPEKFYDDVQVNAGRESLLVTGRRATRICRLPWTVQESSLAVRRDGDLLNVSLSKKRSGTTAISSAP